ncbi:MAG TPA: PLP-dependent aminotransferase family protein [bacterium]|nr:PLP-dependent aminotransferase family protein [bacterium]
MRQSSPAAQGDWWAKLARLIDSQSALHLTPVAGLLPELQRDGDVPLADQIARFYRCAIEDGRVAAGDRLPPIRELAAACSVTRATVQAAYRRLQDRGLVEGAVGRGTVVLAGGVGGGGGAGGSRTLSPYAEAALRRMAMPGAPALPDGHDAVANFAELAPDQGLFPVDEWRAAMDDVLRRQGRRLLGYGHSTFGLEELRGLLAARAHASDPALTAADVLVTAGAQQALDLALRTVCSPGDTVVVTTPSYHHMHGLLRAHGLQVAQVAFGADGLDLAQFARLLARPSVRLCYLMPTFHNPTGRTLDLTQRRRLVDALAGTDVVVVEDEYQQSLRCRGEALPSLRSLDPRGRTITVSTVSKDLFPALRIGWVAGASGMLQPMAAVKRFMDLETSPLLQAALVEFMRRGSHDRHLDAVRTELRRRHEVLQAACAEHLPDGCTVTDPDGGFAVWLELPASGQGEQLADLAAERGVRVVPGSAFDVDGAPSRGVRLSLTRADPEQIERGVRVLAACIRELLHANVATQPFL